MTYYRVEVQVNEGGGFVPAVDGAPGALPGGAMFHVRQDASVGDDALVICTVPLDADPVGWVSRSKSGAEADFATMYGRAPSAAEVP